MLTDEQRKAFAEQMVFLDMKRALSIVAAIERAVLAAHNAGAQGPSSTERDAFSDWWHKKLATGESPIDIAFHMFVELTADDAHPQPQTDAARDVLSERQRQMSVEGWTTKHDDLHTDFGAAKAAAVYALHAADAVGVYSNFWPWESHWWKPTTPRRNLVKAAALILAEIERLDRAKGE